MFSKRLWFITVLLALGLPGVAAAFTISDSFGEFSDATWAGTGIPNDAVASSMQIIDGTTTITVAMNATGRYFNPQLANNGAGVFYAGAGSNLGGPGSTSTLLGALWNWNYYLEIDGAPGVKLSDYQIDIWYDFNPAGPNACCSLAGLGRIDVTAGLLAANDTSTLKQGSENLLFNWLSAPFPPFVIPPGGSFDPNALGNYQFAITVSSNSFPVESLAMEVQVVPVPAAVWLFGSALGLLGWMRRRQ